MNIFIPVMWMLVFAFVLLSKAEDEPMWKVYAKASCLGSAMYCAIWAIKWEDLLC